MASNNANTTTGDEVAETLKTILPDAYYTNISSDDEVAIIAPPMLNMKHMDEIRESDEVKIQYIRPDGIYITKKDISFGKRRAVEIKEIAEAVIPDEYNGTYEIVAGGGCAILRPASVDAPVVRAIQDSDEIRIYYIRDDGVYLTFN